MFRQHIIASGRSQSAWAVKLGISKGYLSGILSGAKRPGLDLAVRIERLTDGAVPVDSWVDVEPVEPSEAA